MEDQKGEIYALGAGTAVELVLGFQSTSWGRAEPSRCKDSVSKCTEARSCQSGDSMLSLSLADCEVHCRAGAQPGQCSGSRGTGEPGSP